jgi:curved DNA-binding protein
MDFVDYYKILGIDKSATPKDIKNAYRKLARKHHPDLHPNDKDAKKNFQLVNEANEVLSDPIKRKKYDEHGHDWKQADEYARAQQQQRSSGQGRSRNYSNQNEPDFSDFFESLFGGSPGGGRSRQTKYRGEDFTAELQLGLLDASKTHQQTLTVNGKKIRITIPAGIENGQTIKIPGHGSPGINGGPNGDLYITFSIANHPGIKRLGIDLYTTIALDLYNAVLGGEITIQTLDGQVKLKVAPETQNGSKIKLKGKGFPVYKQEGQFGDLIVTYEIVIPKNLTEKQKALFTELSKLQS